MPDGGGEGEDACEDAYGDACGGAAVVAFEAELAFEGVADRFDDLAQRAQEPLAGPGRLVARRGPDELEEANECTWRGKVGGSGLFTCRRLEESREYVLKADPRILAVSEPSDDYGVTLMIRAGKPGGPEQLEGCQDTDSWRYWQCDYRGDLLWWRAVESASWSNYYWPAVVGGALPPAACAVELVALRNSGFDPQAWASMLGTCAGLLKPVS